MQLLKKLKQKQTKTDPYYFKTKVEVSINIKQLRYFNSLKRYSDLLLMPW